MTKFQDNMKKLLPIMERAKADGFVLYHGYVWEKKEPWEPAADRICLVEDYPKLTKHIVTEFWEGKASQKVYLSEEEAVKAYYASDSGHVCLEKEEGGKRKGLLSRYGKIEFVDVL